MNTCKDELIDRFENTQMLSPTYFEIGLVKAYLDQVFVRLIERKQQSDSEI